MRCFAGGICMLQMFVWLPGSSDVQGSTSAPCCACHEQSRLACLLCTLAICAVSFRTCGNRLCPHRPAFVKPAMLVPCSAAKDVTVINSQQLTQAYDGTKTVCDPQAASS